MQTNAQTLSHVLLFESQVAPQAPVLNAWSPTSGAILKDSGNFRRWVIRIGSSKTYYLQLHFVTVFFLVSHEMKHCPV